LASELGMARDHKEDSFNPSDAIPEIYYQEALVSVWDFFFGVRDICERSVAHHLSAVVANYSWLITVKLPVITETFLHKFFI
jgi:hypothetical protein